MTLAQFQQDVAMWEDAYRCGDCTYEEYMQHYEELVQAAGGVLMTTRIEMRGVTQRGNY
jgi:hypothetical protein